MDATKNDWQFRFGSGVRIESGQDDHGTSLYVCFPGSLPKTILTTVDEIKDFGEWIKTLHVRYDV